MFCYLLFFQLHVFNMDISLNNNRKCFKFCVYIRQNNTKGTVSQNLYLSPSSHFMKSRKIIFKGIAISYLFLITTYIFPRQANVSWHVFVILLWRVLTHPLNPLAYIPPAIGVNA